MFKIIFLDIYENFEKYLCAILLAIMVFCLGFQVLVRFPLGSGISWTEELGRYAYVWSIYLAISLAAQRSQHVRVVAQFRLLPSKVIPYFILLADTIWVILNIVFAWQGYQLLKHMAVFTETTPTLSLPGVVIYSIVPIGFILMTLRIFQRYYRAWKINTWPDQLGGGDV